MYLPKAEDEGKVADSITIVCVPIDSISTLNHGYFQNRFLFFHYYRSENFSSPNKLFYRGRRFKINTHRKKDF